ncbi:MAG: Spy/CpxP family protein refolding chaperone [Alphaproteobacteria bacterium]
MKQRILMAAAMTAALAAVSPVAAQQQGDQPKQDQAQPGPVTGHGMMRGTVTAGPGGMGPGMMRFGGPMMGVGSCMTGQWTDGQLAFLQAELDLTDAQGKQWGDFANAIGSNADRMASMHEDMVRNETWSSLPTPDRMEKIRQMLAQRVEGYKAIIEASRPLYDSLSSDQKQTFDSLIPACLGLM